MNGKMYTRQGKEIKPCDIYTSLQQPCPSYIRDSMKAGRKYADTFALGTLLQAAGISSLNEPCMESSLLNEPRLLLLCAHNTRLTMDSSFFASVQGTTLPLRYTGLVLLMDIQYSNYVSFSTTYMEYRYYLTAVPKSDFKSEQVIAGARGVLACMLALCRSLLALSPNLGFRCCLTQTLTSPTAPF